MSFATERCRFISSYDGVSRCSHAAHAQDFCRFHFAAHLAGEVTRQGYIADHVSDQVRRRAINFHGVHSADLLVGPGSHSGDGQL